MSEDDSTVDETVAPADEQGPDGENDVTRLTRALEHEREERRQAKEELRLLREDEDTRRKFLTDLGYQIEDEDDGEEEAEDAYGDDEAEEDPRVSKLEQRQVAFEQWQAEQQMEQGLQAFNKDLDGFASEAEVSLSAYERDQILRETLATGSDPKAAKVAFEKHVAYREDLGKQFLEARKRPRVPHVPTGGAAATGGKNPEDMTRQERETYMLERLRSETT